MSEVKDYRLDIRVRNNRLLRRIEAAGYGAIAKFCAHHKLSYNALVNLVAMRRSAVTATGDYREIVLRLCDIFDATPQELFNERQLTASVSPRVTREIDEEQVVSLTGNAEALALVDDRPDADPLRRLENAELADKLLAELTPLQRRVIVLYHGLEDGIRHTCEEVAAKIAAPGAPPYSRAYIDQIIRTAESKMRGAAVRRYRVLPSSNLKYIEDREKAEGKFEAYQQVAGFHWRRPPG